MEEAEIAFKQHYPAFDTTSFLDELRATEYTRLDTQGQIYLDYTGGGLYASSHLRDHMQLLNSHVFGNPHSSNPTSQAMTELDGQARAFVLTFFNASPDEYTAIFTPNASGALRLVGEAYPFAPHGQLLLSFDNHNSVNGMREFARAKGAPIAYVPLEATELRMDETALFSLLELGVIPNFCETFLASESCQNLNGLEIWRENAPKSWVIVVPKATDCPASSIKRCEDFSASLAGSVTFEA